MDIHVTGARVAYPTPREALDAIAARRGAPPPSSAELKVEPKAEDGEVGSAVKSEGGSGGISGGAGSGIFKQGAAAVGGGSAGAEGGGEPGEQQDGADGEPRPPPLGCSSATCESCYVTVRFLGYHR